MAMRQATLTLRAIRRKEEAKQPFSAGAARLAALPAGTLVAVFDSRADTVGAALQLTQAQPEAPVWVAAGPKAVRQIQRARASRSFLSKLCGAFSDDDRFVEQLLDTATADTTVLAVHSSRAYLPVLTAAHHVVDFGRWTTRSIR
jgi:hypothetical protein